jgi:LAO/AO transport system kinase
MILDHETRLEASGQLAERRTRGNLQWMHELISSGLGEMFRTHPAIAELIPKVEEDVRKGCVTPLAASYRLLNLFQPKL